MTDGRHAWLHDHGTYDALTEVVGTDLRSTLWFEIVTMSMASMWDPVVFHIRRELEVHEGIPCLTAP